MRPGHHSGDDDNHPLNPFVRFRHHVDSTLASAFNTMFGFPDDGVCPIGELNSLKAVLFSNYNPNFLRNLPQPVPNDLPEGLDGSLFTFEDAFEDLLAVSWGQPLPDIHHRYEQKKLLRQMFPSGEPSWFWLRRLRASGLLGPEPPRGDIMDRSNWDHLHAELDRRAEEVWGRPEKPSRYPDPWKENMSALETMEIVSKLRGELAEEFGKLHKFLEMTPFNLEQRSGPDHTDDLFLSFQNWAESGKRSWDAFMRSYKEQVAADEKEKYPDATPETKVEESRDEHVDQDGYVHSKVTRREIDSQGNELRRTTSYQMYPSSDRNSGETHSRMEGACNKSSDKEEDRRKSGWFWK